MSWKKIAPLLILVALSGCGNPYQEGMDLIASGDYERAAQFFIELAQKRPDDPRAFHELGYVYTRLKMYNDAARAYNRALQLNPDYFEAAANLGYVHLERKMPTAAEPPLLKALSLKPDCESCHVNLAWVYYHSEELELATEQVEKAIELGGMKEEYSQLARLIATKIVIRERAKKERAEEEAKKALTEPLAEDGDTAAATDGSARPEVGSSPAPGSTPIDGASE